MERCIVKAWAVEQALEVDASGWEESKVSGVELCFALEKDDTSQLYPRQVLSRTYCFDFAQELPVCV